MTFVRITKQSVGFSKLIRFTRRPLKCYEAKRISHDCAHMLINNDLSSSCARFCVIAVIRATIEKCRASSFVGV